MNNALLNRCVKRTAIAPGAISKETDKIIPTDFSVATTVSEIMLSNP
ncbi:hypothetical protein UUU_24930 (plasmid) [Klebsiella pneumoniae subsp. pneumoniae DSM 30104 = JCM 1662 = NBRC 14940]|nr:hypothetical protein UUU_24930 [Klebsiella pneumoniae subsp. pneumoniae DSM 30104 = JCM 1662 = NBRC 14940]